jgi:CrcB protein
VREFLLISIGAALGANARYWLANWFAERCSAEYPWGTLFINVTGSLLIGLLVTLLGHRLLADPAYRLLLVTGFLGAYTTFSTFSYETVALLQTGAYLTALGNAINSVALGLTATVGGIWLARWLG